MPFALVPPKAGRSPYWRVRGTEYGIAIDRSTRVGDKASALKLLKQWRDEAKRQHLAAPADETRGLRVVEATPTATATAPASMGRMEIVLVGGERVLVGADVDATALARIVKALGRR
jgi:hypothetical protein